MLKTRRRRDANPDERRCRLCGTKVVVGSDGRCPLGHHVEPPATAASADAPAHHVPASAETPAVAPAPAAAPPAESAGGPTPAPDQQADSARLLSDVFSHPYDEVLSWESAAPPAAPVSRPAEPASPPPEPAADPTPPPAAVHPAPADAGGEPPADDLRTAIDELLTWEAPEPAGPPRPPQSPEPPAPERADQADPPPVPAAPPAPPAPLPAPPAPLPAPAGTRILPSVLDIDLDDLPTPAPTASAPAPGRAEFVDEEAEEATAESSRRRAATLVGSGLFALVAGFSAAVYAFPA